MVASRPTDERSKAIRELRSRERLQRTRAGSARILAAIDKLTQREREVLSALAWGLTSTETALILELSPRTVEIHRASMLRKLDACNGADAVRLALTAGMKIEICLIA